MTTARNGAEALASVRRDAPDLVVSDVVMPERDGFELLSALRRDADLQDIPFILMGARPSDDAGTFDPQLSGATFLIKPFSPQHLLDLIRRLLGEDRGGAGVPPAPRTPPPMPPPAATNLPPKRRGWWEA